MASRTNSEKYERSFEGDGEASPSRTRAVVREGYDERVTHILEAATEVIAREGYQGASMRKVAAAAGVSLAGIYHYFDSKEKMLFIIQFRAFNSLQAKLKERLVGVSDPVEQVHVMVRNHVSYFASNMPGLKVCSHELESLSGERYEEIRRIRHDYYRFARSVIDRLFDAYAPESRLDRHVATMSLFGMLNWLYRWYDPSTDRSPARIAQQIASQFIAGVVKLEEPAPMSD